MTGLVVRRDHPLARLPTRGSAGAAGYDLYSVEEHELAPGCRACVSVGIAVTTPPGTYGRIAPRSGMAIKSGIHVLAGVVDADYTDTLRVVLVNLDPHATFQVHAGDRIAQLLLECVAHPAAEVVEVADLDKTARGDGGFGSTGV